MTTTKANTHNNHDYEQGKYMHSKYRPHVPSHVFLNIRTSARSWSLSSGNNYGRFSMVYDATVLSGLHEKRLRIEFLV